MGVPLFKWSFSKLTFKNRDELALLIVGRDFVHSGEENLGIPPNSGFKHYCISPANFVILAEPTTIVLCEKNPSRYVFHNEELSSSFRPIYSSRKQDWGAKGAKVIKPKEEPKPSELEGKKVELKPEPEVKKVKLEYARMWNMDTESNGEVITKRKAREFRNNKARFELLVIGNGIRDIYI